MTTEPSVDDVKIFWEDNPLHREDSEYEVGTLAFFEDQKRVYHTDIFAGGVDYRMYPDHEHAEHVLDLGCGPGFWTIELMQHGARKITSADLTNKAVEITKKRAQLYEYDITCQVENAENLSFKDKSFTHVNCQGVIHHTPDTKACVSEIARVLKDNGTASISVYYKNFILNYWSVFKYIGKLFALMGAQMKGRGREHIYKLDDVNEIVRFYDGADNPVGKSYSKNEFIDLLSDYFIIKETFVHFFPVRSLPFGLPLWLHKFAQKYFGFLIVANVKKK